MNSRVFLDMTILDMTVDMTKSIIFLSIMISLIYKKKKIEYRLEHCQFYTSSIGVSRSDKSLPFYRCLRI